MMQQSETGVYQVIQNTCPEGLCYYLLGMKIQLKKKLLQTLDSTVFEVPRDPQVLVTEMLTEVL